MKCLSNKIRVLFKSLGRCVRWARGTSLGILTPENKRAWRVGAFCTKRHCSNSANPAAPTTTRNSNESTGNRFRTHAGQDQGQ